MGEYALHIGTKTKFLNLFRRIFTTPPFENFLIKQVESNQHVFWQKLIPPNYLYKKNSVRNATINGINFLLDVSNVVEHLVYFRIAPENFRVVEKRLKTAEIVFDIGANIGSTSLFFASVN